MHKDQGTPKEIIHFHSSNSLRLAKNAMITKRCRALIRTSSSRASPKLRKYQSRGSQGPEQGVLEAQESELPYAVPTALLDKATVCDIPEPTGDTNHAIRCHPFLSFLFWNYCLRQFDGQICWPWRPKCMTKPRGIRFKRMEITATKVYHRKVPVQAMAALSWRLQAWLSLRLLLHFLFGQCPAFSLYLWYFSEFETQIVDCACGIAVFAFGLEALKHLICMVFALKIQKIKKPKHKVDTAR